MHLPVIQRFSLWTIRPSKHSIKILLDSLTLTSITRAGWARHWQGGGTRRTHQRESLLQQGHQTRQYIWSAGGQAEQAEWEPLPSLCLSPAPNMYIWEGEVGQGRGQGRSEKGPEFARECSTWCYSSSGGNGSGSLGWYAFPSHHPLSAAVGITPIPGAHWAAYASHH